MVKMLINNGANTKSKTGTPCKSVIQLAADEGLITVMEEIVKHGVDWKDSSP
jgi:hypothetical protein